jgi:hypothetical protein
MAQGPVFSGDLDPDIAALIGGNYEEMAPSGKTSASAPSPSRLGSPASPAASPEFGDLFGDMDLTGTVKSSSPASVDLTKKKFPAITKTEETPPNRFLSGADYYKVVMSGGGEEAQALHQLLQKYMQTQDPKDKSIYRQKLIPAYWNTIKRFALGCGKKDFPHVKLMTMRFGCVLPNLLTPEQRDILERVVQKNETGEPVYYLDEWIRMVGTGQLKASSTDEVRLGRMDDKSKFQALMAKAQGKRDSSEGILRAKAEERKAFEDRLKEKVDFICGHDSQPGMLHIPAPYTDLQKKAFSESAEIFRQLAAADKELQKSIIDFQDAEKEITGIEEKASGVSENQKADLQTVAQEFETVRQMAKMTCGRQGNHFPILSKEYFHGSLREIGSRENVIQTMAMIESIDAEAFCRHYKTQLNRIVPYVVLVPSYGEIGVCWEPFDRFNRATSRGRIAVPMFSKSLPAAVLNAVADLRWQTAKEKASYYWMEEGLTGNYYQSFVAKKLKGDVKEFFIADYVLWITKESEGVQKLEKDTRQIFWRYLPFTQAIKDKLKTRSYVYQELYQKDQNRAMSDGY